MSDSATLVDNESKKKTKSKKPDIKISVYKTIETKDIFGNETTVLIPEVRRIEDSARMYSTYPLDDGAESDKNSYCPVTKLKKFLNDPRSKFLSDKEVEYYYHYYLAIYYRDLYPRLTSQWYDAPLKIQFREIAHSIRNEDSNHRNNSKRRMRKNKGGESLF